MPRYVVDTNVPIVANGGDANIAIDCRIAAIELLQEALGKGIIYLDTSGEIQLEYSQYLSPRGQPGVGDRFYLEVINSHPDKVARIEVHKRPDGEFEDLPQPIIDAGFDPSDRKFAAVAIKADAHVYNAVDPDWIEHRAVIEANGIPIILLCGCDKKQWFNT